VAQLEDRLEDILGQRPRNMEPLAGGCISSVWRAEVANDGPVVVKQAGPGASLEPEAWMLAYLRDRTDLPVPDVIFADVDLLVLSHLENTGRISAKVEEHAADLIAGLHAHTADSFGLGRDTVIGPLNQPNPQTDDWIAFFRDHRLLYMAGQCRASGRLPDDICTRVEKLAGRLDDFISPSAAPTLIHGDLWDGNVLTDGIRITGFIDPAIYYADPEIELAFTTLFNTFGARFFDRYREHRKIEPEFHQVRCGLYNLYPLLVHVRLFGGSYVGQVDAVLRRLGVG
jgi:fructosamine-3-kinase